MTTANMSNPSTTPLTGDELKSKVKELQGQDKKAIAKACGYTSQTKNGQERINLMAFYNALMAAEGLDIEGGSTGGSRGKAPTYRASVHKNGNLLVGATYTKEMGLKPGDEFELKLSKTGIKLTPVE